MAEESLLILSTFPDIDTARRIANVLVEEKLVACVNLTSPVESIYRWQGKIENASEILAIIKSTIGRYQLLENRIRALHPYEVPEIIAIRIQDGHLDYLRWIEQSVIE